MRPLAKIAVPLIVLIAVALSSSSLEAQTSGAPTAMDNVVESFKPSNWMPKFKKPQWKMPSFKGLMPGQADKERIVGKKNNLVTDVSDTAKRSWNKTKEVLNPQRLNPFNLLAAPASPAPGGASSKASQEPGFFRSLFMGPQPPPENRVADANDFLQQSRVKR